MSGFSWKSARTIISAGLYTKYANYTPQMRGDKISIRLPVLNNMICHIAELGVIQISWIPKFEFKFVLSETCYDNMMSFFMWFCNLVTLRRYIYFSAFI